MQNSTAPSRPKLIGMLTPSSNTVVEPYTNHIAWPLFPRVSVHYGRFRVKRIALDDDANGQFTLDPILAAADLLSDAKTDVIAWNGTSASWLGFHTDERLCQQVSAHAGCPATTAVLSLNKLLAKFGAARIGLVSPYTPDVQDRIIANYAAIGIETVAERHENLSDNFSFATVGEERIAAMCREVAAAKCDAIVILCTNMRGALVAAELERELGIPVLDSVAFTLWGTLDALRIPTGPLAGHGMMFRQ